MKNILVVDDNKDIREALASVLGSHLRDATIKTAANGKKSEELLKSGQFDLILTDLDMPLADGFALIEYVKKNHPSIPLCVMTGDCAPEIRERLRAMGVKWWIEKPFQFEALATLLGSLMKGETLSDD